VLAPRILAERVLRELLAIPDLAPIAYEALLARGLTVLPEELVPWGRTIARASLDPAACERWARCKDDRIFFALSLVLGGKDEDLRDGAHGVLLTLAGKPIAADPLLWKSWLTAHPGATPSADPVSEGRIEAAVVRGTRVLRNDLLDDGRALWSADGHAHWVCGSTGLAVMGLLAAGYPKDHPAIEKAVQTTLAVFGPGGPGLPAFPARGYETYNLACLAMALCELDPKRFRVPLQGLHARLVHGMLEDGLWSYRCLSPTDAT
jgi:hypothetical protein